MRLTFYQSTGISPYHISFAKRDYLKCPLLKVTGVLNVNSGKGFQELVIYI